MNEVEVTSGIFKSFMLSRRHVANVQKVFNEIEGTWHIANYRKVLNEVEVMSGIFKKF